MGNCPSGFEAGATVGTCRISCPSGFTYTQEGRPRVEKCVSQKRSDRFITLNILSAVPRNRQDIPAAYPAETARFNQELERIKSQIDRDEQTLRSLEQSNTQRAEFSREYKGLQGEYSAHNDRVADTKMLKEVADSLKPLRPKTAPSSDLEIERKAITDFQSKSLLFIQIVLAIVVLALVSYLIMPPNYAHSVVFLLLCVAISFGFFLRR